VDWDCVGFTTGGAGGAGGAGGFGGAGAGGAYFMALM